MASHGNQVPQIYKEAIRRYEETTNKKLDEPSIVNIRTVHDLLAEVDRRNNKFSEFRETRDTLFRVLEGALMPVELVSNLASGASSMAFPPSSLVFGAATYLINAAKRVSASYDAIEGLMGTLKDFTVRLSIYNQEHISNEMSSQLSEVLVTLIEIFALSRKAIKGGRLLKLARNVLVGSEDKIQAAVAKLAKLTETESRLVGAETLTEAKRTGRSVNDIAVTVTATNVIVQETGVTVGQMSLEVTEMKNLMLAMDEFKNEAKTEQEKGHQTVKQILRPSVTAQDWYDKISKSRVPGTGDWIRGEDFFQAWIEKNIPVLWVSGNPGAGKSYLSSNIISFLRDQHPQGVQHPSHVSVGYFFFKDDNPETRSFHQALRDLAYQISQNDPVYEKYVAANCNSSEDIKTLQSVWRILFVNFFIKKKHVDSSVYLIIDGVDEAFEAERRIFFDLIKDINEVASHARIQLVMVGRPQLSDFISDALEIDVPTIHVTADKNSADIVHYIKTSIRKSNLLKRVSAKLRAEIVETLSIGAQGMFIWVDLVLQELLKKRSELAMRKSLSEAPKGLTEMLRHVLESFSLNCIDEEPENLNDLLAWTACASRPLKLGELDTILKLNSPEGDGMIYLEGALRKQFASFFSLTREDGLSTAELQSVRQVGDETDDETNNSRPDEGFEDVDNLTDFDSNPTTTEVTFCHASVGDFLRDESQGKVSIGKGYPAIGVNFNEAKISVLKTCLELFCDDELANKPQQSSQSMMPYAFAEWYKHLCAVEPSKTELTQRKMIGGLLAKMFGQEAFMKNWAGGVGWGFFTDENVKTVRSWLDDEDVVRSLPSEDQTFVKVTSESHALTFKPLARYIAKQWLEDVWWLPANCCNIVHGYLSLEKGTPLKGTLVGLHSAEDMISVAEWPNLDKTALWHRRLAIALRDKWKSDESLEHFTKALELDSKMWLARGGMASALVQKQEYERALELDTITEQDLEQQLIEDSENSALTKLNLHAVQERMAECYLALEDEENSFAYYQHAQRNHRSCNTCTNDILSKMLEKHLYSDIIDLLKAMDGEDVPEQKISRLTESLWQNQYDGDYHTIAATAARETNNLEFLMEAYGKAIHAARKKLKMVVASLLELCLANICDRYAGEQKKAVRIWTKIFETFAGSKEQSEMGATKRRASVCLARYYFQQALDTGVGSEDANKYVRKLEKLVKTRARSVNDSSTFTSASDSAIILGQWYRLNGRNEDARACFSPSIQEGLQILSDDDPSNDEEGYFKLSMALMAADDDKNAIAVLRLYGVHADDESSNRMIDSLESIENEKNESSAKEEENDNDSSSVSADSEIHATLKCDGICNREFPNCDSIYFCRYCSDIGFCGDCMRLVKDGEMPLNVCNRKHEWLFVPPRPQMTKNDKSKILVGDVLVDFEDWKNRLRQQWKD